MKRLASAALGAVLASLAPAAASDDGLAASRRTLLLFAAAEDPALAEQTALLSRVPAESLSERDMVVLHVPPSGETRTLFGEGGEPRPAEALRASRDVLPGAGFTAILVGKDGGTKWRGTRPARPEELFALIDSMPMRLREMRRNGPAG